MSYWRGGPGREKGRKGGREKDRKGGREGGKKDKGRET